MKSVLLKVKIVLEGFHSDFLFAIAKCVLGSRVHAKTGTFTCLAVR